MFQDQLLGVQTFALYSIILPLHFELKCCNSRSCFVLLFVCLFCFEPISHELAMFSRCFVDVLFDCCVKLFTESGTICDMFTRESEPHKGQNEYFCVRYTYTLFLQVTKSVEISTDPDSFLQK